MAVLSFFFFFFLVFWLLSSSVNAHATRAVFRRAFLSSWRYGNIIGERERKQDCVRKRVGCGKQTGENKKRGEHPFLLINQ